MKHGSLFSGIGGFDLAAEMMGWENMFHCEWNEFGKKVLKYYWPKAKSYGDIDETDFTIWRGQIDVISGGFPCQPYSHAGRRKGKEDDRHKWPQMLRAIREIQPRWIVGENVYGLINWSGGLVFDEVQADLENEGYEVTPYILPACSKNAPHRRERIWFIAHASRIQWITTREERQQCGQRLETFGNIDGNASQAIIANTTSNGQSKSRQFFKQFSTETAEDWEASWVTNDGRWPTQSPVLVRNDGFPAKLDAITISDWIDESNKSAGNAVVPQLVHQLFKTIEQYELLLK